MKFDWVRQLGVTAAYCCPWFCYTCTWVAFLVPYIVGRIYWCGGKKGAFCVEPLAVIPPPLLPPLYFPLFISVTSACYLRGVGAHGWVVRFCQALMQSPAWSWLPMQLLTKFTATIIVVVSSNNCLQLKMRAYQTEREAYKFQWMYKLIE